MKLAENHTRPTDSELRTIRTPSAWPLTFTAHAHFGTSRAAHAPAGR
jgi:hypothetical protein